MALHKDDDQDRDPFKGAKRTWKIAMIHQFLEDPDSPLRKGGVLPERQNDDVPLTGCFWNGLAGCGVLVSVGALILILLPFLYVMIWSLFN